MVHIHPPVPYGYRDYNQELIIDACMILTTVIILIINIPLFFWPKLLSKVKEKHGKPKEYLFLLK